MRRLLKVALLAFLLTGCTVGPKYKKPTFQPPPTFYTEAQASSDSIADLGWWDLFKDPVLQGLIREAFNNNYDLKLAVSRVEQERALLGVTRSQYYPQVGYDGNISGQTSPLIANHTYYGYSISTFWEIDLFGRLRRMNEAQRAVYFATEEARRDIRLLAVNRQGLLPFCRNASILCLGPVYSGFALDLVSQSACNDLIRHMKHRKRGMPLRHRTRWPG